MGAIDKFLKRWGYAKLDRYGLVLTSEERVITTRPAVLDDGLGNRIVGWLDGDLAAMELEHFGVKKKGPPKKIRPPAGLSKQAPVATPPAAPAPPTPPPAARPLPGVAPIAKPAPVAAEPQVDEDEWEWEIAMARARAAAEAVEEARRDLLGASAVIAAAVIQRKTTPGMAVQTPPEPIDSWPKTEPFMERFDDKGEVSPQVLTPAQKTVLVETSKRTVIPVPQLPTVADPRSLRPVTHSPPSPRPVRAELPLAPSRRYARGTGRLEDTVRTRIAPEDKTSPYIELPTEVRPSGFAHTKRVAAKQR